MKRWLAKAAALAAVSVGIGCGGSPPCTNCPNISGNWSLTFGTATSTSPNCQFIVSMGTPYPLSITQNPPGGSGLTVIASLDAGDVTLTGTLYKNGSLTVQASGSGNQGGISGSESDTVQATLGAANNTLTGDWTESFTYTDNTQTPPKTSSCTGTDNLTATFP